VFDGDPATPRGNGTQTPPNFWPMYMWPNGWIDQDATWYGGRPRPDDIVLDGVAASP